MKTVVLDPGHGGTDYGAVNGLRYEKNDNLRLANAVRDILSTNPNLKVLMTRTNDTYVDLNERSRFSNNNNADLFASIHRNSSSSAAANGVENFVDTSASGDEKLYAKNVLDNIVNVGVQSNRGLKQSDFSVLRYTNAPAQLIEMGFISNAVDNALFDQNFYAYAKAIADGIKKSLNVSDVAPPTASNTIIKGIQQTLNSRYGFGLSADGIAGPQTKQALTRALQMELNRQYGAGLVVDGIFGQKTKMFVPTLRNGSRGNITYLLQAALYIRGHLLNSVDGVFGPNTDLMVRRFQQANNLVVDGIAGPNTFEKLFKW